MTLGTEWGFGDSHMLEHTSPASKAGDCIHVPMQMHLTARTSIPHLSYQQINAQKTQITARDGDDSRDEAEEPIQG